MALGRRKRDDGLLFIPTSELPRSAGHPFYRALNLAIDTSYFFTGRAAPENPTPLDLLGPWPLRLAAR